MATIWASRRPIRDGAARISDVAWSDPYFIGFMVMLISIIARMEGSKISADSLCLVQCRAQADTTPMQSELTAEQLLLLSADHNRDFELGCHNAAAFSSVLFGTTTLQEGPASRACEINLKVRLTRIFAQREALVRPGLNFSMCISLQMHKMPHHGSDTLSTK